MKVHLTNVRRILNAKLSLQATLSIVPGRVTCIVGTGDSGRSELLRIIALRDRNWTGRYMLDRRSVMDLSPADYSTLRGGAIGYFDASDPLTPDLTVAENLEVPLTYLGLSQGERQRRIDETLTHFSLRTTRHKQAARLSPAQKHLAGIARALVARPTLVVLDEPMALVSGARSCQVIAALDRAASEGVAVVCGTSDSALSEIADVTYAIDYGLVNTPITHIARPHRSGTGKVA